MAAEVAGNIKSKEETKEKNMFSSRWIKYGLMVFSLLFFVTYVLELDAYARIGGSRSFGSRGSRSYSTPASPQSSPSSPSRQMGAAPSAPAAAPQSGGFLRGMAGGLVGGMIGGMLFRSLGFAGEGTTGGGGIGIFEILLMAGILYGIWWYMKKRRREAEATAGSCYSTAAGQASQPSSYAPSYGGGPAESGIDDGIGHIRQMDSAFDEQKFKEQCLDSFFQIQGAWANRNMSSVRSMFTDEMYRIIQTDADELRKKKQINRLDNIAVRNVEINEVWQEAGNDFITVRFYANLLDYTVDETTGTVLSGSKTDPVKFEEFWTFTRPVGSNPWQLSAINQLS